jgi:type II secretion system protein D
MRFLYKFIVSTCLMALCIGAFCQTPQYAPPQAAAIGPSGQQTASPDPAAPGPPPQNTDRRGRGPGQNDFRGFGSPRKNSDQSEEAQYTMTFERADVQAVIRFLSMITKIPIVVDPDLKGNVTIVSEKRLMLQDVYQVIQASLLVRGFTMVGGLDSKVIRVTSLKKAIVGGTGVSIGNTVKPGTAGDELVTQVMQPEHVSSDNLRDQLKPLVSSDSASIVSIASTNTLVITDTADNVRRLMEVIKSVDKNTTGLLTVKTYTCKFASADVLATTLNTLFQTSSTSSSAQNNQRPVFSLFGGGPGPGGRNNNNTASTTVGLADLMGQITVTSDVQTNQLLISGTADRIARVLDVVKELDVATEPEVKVKFFPLKYADASTLATELNSVFEQPQGGASSTGTTGAAGGGNRGFQATSTQTSTYAGLKRNVVVADVRTNAIIVTATEQNMKAFADMIKELDNELNELSSVTKVYHLKYALSENLAPNLQTLFRGTTGSTGNTRYGIGNIAGAGSSSQNQNAPLMQLQQVTVVSEPKSNSLLVTGPQSVFTMLDDMIKDLDKRQSQVFIEAAIVDVTLTKETQFGVEWSMGSTGGKSPTPVASTNFGLNGTGSSATSTTTTPTISMGTAGLTYSVLNNNLSVLLQALETRSDVKVLSTPSVTTVDNTAATISIGENVPYETGATIANGTTTLSTGYQNVAITLLVTPHVNGQSDVIGMDINQSINEIIGYNATLNNAPIIAARQAITSINAKDGQTIVIGGIIQDSKTRNTTGIPFLSSLPIIGPLFRVTDNPDQKTELMVFLTPRILKADKETSWTSEQGIPADDITNKAKKELTLPPPSGIGAISKDAKPPM